ncbi:hypothetical protein BV25DRAFT_1902584 [Artomyces pyxidatus]|uniref:Uncharacterized protein n=1 Tax=Artomyces pyxidatus TaxID=48021 RepID=A0ACB8SMJ4_9AGAM|nr:hypothetical protein BV25DRAFT_1902584 [Artomyces pyxidatus]
MGQSFVLVSLDRRTVLKPIGKMGEVFCTWEPQGIVQHFMTPLPVVRSTRHVADAGLGILRKVPVEIIDCIFHELSDDIVSIICFCLAHKFLLAIGQTTIDAYHRAKTFVGTRIICVGDGAETRDLPANLLTEGELEELSPVRPAQQRNPSGDDNNNSDGSKADDARNVNGDENDTVDEGDDTNGDGDGPYNHDGDDADAESFQSSLFYLAYSRRYKAVKSRENVPSNFLWTLPTHERNSFRDMLQPNYSSPHPWALFNLSKHEYVRADAVAELGGYKASDPLSNRGEEIGLGAVLLGRVCWSSDPSISMWYDGGLHRGVWAGDRFKISPLVFKPGEEAQWKDVSEEAVAELEAIWKAEFGDSWRNRIRDRRRLQDESTTIIDLRST